MHKILMTYASTEGLDPILNNPEFKIEVVAKPTPEKFKEIIGEYDGLLIRSEVKVTPEIIEAGKKLKFIGRAGTGVDNVDIPSATQRGIVVANVPGGNTISAAEHTIGLMLAIQVYINISMTLGISPVVGVPLPLMSYGGSSILVTFIALGILVNIDRTRSVF